MRLSLPTFPRPLDWLFLIVVAAVSMVLGLLLGFGPPQNSHLQVVPYFAMPMLLICSGTVRKMFPKLMAVLALIIWVGLVLTVNAYATYVLAATNLPLWDGALARFDQLFGLDHVGLRDSIGSNKWLSGILVFAYVNTAQPLGLAAIFLLVRGEMERLKNTISILSLSVAATLILSALFPAIGAYPYFGMTTDHAPYLIHAPTNNWYGHYSALRAGTMRAFPLDDWKAIIDFPSFHAIYTLIALYAVAHIRPLAIASTAFSTIVLVSTIPIGGHYFADVLAGFVIWALAVRIVEAKSLSAIAPSALWPSAYDTAHAWTSALVSCVRNATQSSQAR